MTTTLTLIQSTDISSFDSGDFTKIRGFAANAMILRLMCGLVYVNSNIVQFVRFLNKISNSMCIFKYNTL